MDTQRPLGRPKLYASDHAKWLHRRARAMQNYASRKKMDVGTHLTALIMILRTIIAHASDLSSTTSDARIECVNVHSDTLAQIYNAYGAPNGVKLNSWNSGQITTLLTMATKYACIKHGIRDQHTVATNVYRQHSRVMYTSLSDPIDKNATLLIDACNDIVTHLENIVRRYARRKSTHTTRESNTTAPRGASR
jgi:hypothetical protein